MNYKEWIIARKWDILTVVFIGLMFIPSVRMPVMVFIQQTFAGKPSLIEKERQDVLVTTDWRLVDLEGNSHPFSATNGKVRVINFWATWCPPCVAELPSLQQLYNRYKQKVAFYFVTNEDPKVIKQFLKEKGYDFPVYASYSSFPPRLSYQSIPTTIVMDKIGHIVVNEIGAHDWIGEDFIEQMDRLVEQ